MLLIRYADGYIKTNFITAYFTNKKVGFLP